jgi:hypothetical protein
MKSWLFVAVIAVVGACGASSAEVKAAQTAQYRAPRQELFKIALQTAAQDYKIEAQDAERAILFTEGQWYNPEGGRESVGAGDRAQVVDHSVMLMMVVEVMGMEGADLYVQVTPKVFQYLEGSPKPRELKPDDPNVPGWIQGRVETLQLAIYKNAKQYEVPR